MIYYLLVSDFLSRSQFCFSLSLQYFTPLFSQSHSSTLLPHSTFCPPLIRLSPCRRHSHPILDTDTHPHTVRAQSFLPSPSKFVVTKSFASQSVRRFFIGVAQFAMYHLIIFARVALLSYSAFLVRRLQNGTARCSSMRFLARLGEDDDPLGTAIVNLEVNRGQEADWLL
jgi:hypothetical protein